MSRNIKRSVARKLYDGFSRTWRREKRMAGEYGKPGRKPTFNMWYHMHDRNAALMAQSTPADVQEYLGLDPWAESQPLKKERSLEDHDRGVVTIPMVTAAAAADDWSMKTDCLE